MQEEQNFIQYWVSKNKSEQRVGYLYGYYAEDPNYQNGVRAIVEAIYEPPQVGFGFNKIERGNFQLCFLEGPGPHEGRVDREQLGPADNRTNLHGNQSGHVLVQRANQAGGQAAGGLQFRPSERV
jgi:hypothetical protein